MAVSRNILGMNARNFLYIRRYNPPSAKRVADDKLETKKLLLENNLTTPNLFATFYTREDILNFDWSPLPERGFVIKPARGYGGGGILSIKKWQNQEAISITGKSYSIKALNSHLLDILEGAFSLQYLPDKAFIEERILPHAFFKKLSPTGIPDVRIIVFNQVPVMAMMRLPTSESTGRANLHQGALGLGIDIRTGITTHAVYKNKPIHKIPDTKLKPRGIKIPNWNELLLLSAKAAKIIGLGYIGVDIAFDGKYGPLILEVNARPGLSIQIANSTSLRTRLERVEDMNITSPERGVEVGKSLFAESFSEKVQTGAKVLPIIHEVTLKSGDRQHTIKAKLDTGAFRTSIDETVAKDLGLEINEDRKVFVKSASGTRHRHTVSLTFELAGKKINTIASVVDRSHMRYPMIVGARDLKGFLINPETVAEEDELDENEERED